MAEMYFGVQVQEALDCLEDYYLRPHGHVAFDEAHLALLIALKDALLATGNYDPRGATTMAMRLADYLYRRSPRWRMRIVYWLDWLRQRWPGRASGE